MSCTIDYSLETKLNFNLSVLLLQLIELSAEIHALADRCVLAATRWLLPVGSFLLVVDTFHHVVPRCNFVVPRCALLHHAVDIACWYWCWPLQNC